MTTQIAVTQIAVAQIAVVGAGIAGISCARTLHAAGSDVVLFDRGRTPGGRVATARSGEGRFDHGAQFFTIRDGSFANAIVPLARHGRIAEWTGPFRRISAGHADVDPRPDQRRFVGVPTMATLALEFARGLAVQSSARVDAIRGGPGAFLLLVHDHTTGEQVLHGPFRDLVLAIPAANAERLLTAGDRRDSAARHEARRLAPRLGPCIAAMVQFVEPVGAAEGGLFVRDHTLAWSAHDGGKPGRGDRPNYVLHGTAAWSASRIDQDPEQSARELVDALGRVLESELPHVAALRGHRWRYALPVPDEPAGDRPGDVGDPSTAFFLDAEERIVLCGDAYTGGRVEGAYGSGVAAAQAVLALTAPNRSTRR
jgi:renalase